MDLIWIVYILSITSNGTYTDACKAFVEASGGISEFDYEQKKGQRVVAKYLVDYYETYSKDYLIDDVIITEME